MPSLATTALPVAAAALLAACAGPGPMATMMKVDNAALPEAVRVPAGRPEGDDVDHRRRRDHLRMPREEGRRRPARRGFVGPVATLYGEGRKTVGKSCAGPTWEAADGSRVTGKQVAVAPASPGNIPLPLVKAAPAMGAGPVTGVSYSQRLNTKGGVAPAMACDANDKRKRQVVACEADHVFYGM